MTDRARVGRLHRLQTLYDESFAREYGPWRPFVAQVADKFLACGMLEHGFARIMSRKHVVKHGWREARHTLLHEMVHQRQHETGAPVDHLAGFRRKARAAGITPSARRDVMPLERRKRRVASADWRARVTTPRRTSGGAW